MEKRKQLSIFMENKPGVLHEVLNTFADNKINIFAITVIDTVDHAVIRLILDDVKKASHLLDERGMLSVESEVICMELPNEVGAFANITQKLAKSSLNIDYAYGTVHENAKTAMMVLHIANVDKAMEILK